MRFRQVLIYFKYTKMNNIMQDHLTNLRVISKVQEGQSLDTTKKLSVYEPSFWNWIMRKWGSDGKVETVRFLRDFYRTLDQSTEQLINDICKANDAGKNKYLENAINLARQIRSSLNGINNLTKTYKKFPDVVADLESITQDVAIITYKQLIAVIPKDKLCNLNSSITINGTVVYEGIDDGKFIPADEDEL
jgi:hypothetical protein